MGYWESVGTCVSCAERLVGKKPWPRKKERAISKKIGTKIGTKNGTKTAIALLRHILILPNI
jgi:hypothetical protein